RRHDAAFLVLWVSSSSSLALQIPSTSSPTVPPSKLFRLYQSSAPSTSSTTPTSSSSSNNNVVSKLEFRKDEDDTDDSLLQERGWLRWMSLGGSKPSRGTNKVILR